MNLSSVAEPGHSSRLAQRVERRRDGREMHVQIVGVVVDIQEPGNDLTFGRMIEQEVHRGELVMNIVVGIELAQRNFRAIVLLDDFHRSRLI